MKSMFVLFRWELRRVLSNWRQTMAVFLIPSVVLLIALYVFPLLVDYLSTGNVGKAPVILVDPDPIVEEFIQKDTLASAFSYKTWSTDTYDAALLDGRAAEATGNGSIIILFQTSFRTTGDTSEISYPDAIAAFFNETAAGNTSAKAMLFLSFIRIRPSSCLKRWQRSLRIPSCQGTGIIC